MSWQTKIVLFFGAALGAVSYSLIGLLVFNVARLKEGGIPFVLYIPVLAIYLTLWICHRVMSREAEPLEMTPWRILLGFFAVVPGAVLASLLWAGAAQIYFDSAWNHAKKAGYAYEPPKAEPVDISEDNAVVWLQRAGAEAKLDEKTNEADFLGDFIREAAGGKVYLKKMIRVKAILKAHSKTLSYLDRAFRCSKVNWQPYGFGVDGPSPRFSNFLFLSKMACCREIIHARERNYDRAAREVKMNLWLARVMFPPNLLIGDMVGIVLYHQALDSAEYRFQELPFEELDSAWSSYVDAEAVIQGVKRAMSIEFILGRKLLAEKFSFNKMNFDWSSFLYASFIKFDSASGIRCGEEFMRCFDLPYPQIEPAYEKAQKNLEKEGWILSRIAMPRFEKMYGKALACAVKLRVSRLALNARRYFNVAGHWPWTLKALDKYRTSKFDSVDPFNETPIKMRENRNDLLIYSVGPDLVDDGGLEPYDRKTEKGDIVFRLVMKDPLSGKEKQ